MNKEQIIKWLNEIFNNKKIINLKEHRYVINPLTDHEPFTSSEMLKTAVETYKFLWNFTNVTKIIWEEDRGWFLAALLSYETWIPFWLVKWNPSDYEWQLWIDFRNAYTHWKMYLNWAEKWDRVIIIEDLIDTWWTIIGLVELLKKSEIEIVDIIVLAAKEENNGINLIYEKTWIMPKVWCIFTLIWENSLILSYNL